MHDRRNARKNLRIVLRRNRLSGITHQRDLLREEVAEEVHRHSEHKPDLETGAAPQGLAGHEYNRDNSGYCCPGNYASNWADDRDETGGCTSSYSEHNCTGCACTSSQRE